MDYNQKDAAKYSVGKTLTQLFRIPETYDMVRSLFDPTLKKSISDFAIVVSLLMNVVIWWWYPYSTPIFIGLYVFWRLSYNVGIGYLLYRQSHSNQLFKWFEKWEDNRFVQMELNARLDKKLREDVPKEFKTWIIFRSLVNLILMNDFTTYMLLVISCSSQAIDRDHMKITVLRWFLGTGFFIFNIIVKLDAHKIVKDYAWYWGDFFFRLQNNEDLIFDGVFDLAPHPMYSIGYAGYYGFALMTKSYTVLFMSIFGHILQFAFLKIVEDPHIEKIYGSESNQEFDFIKKRDHDIFKDDLPLVMLNDFNYIRPSDWLSVIIISLFVVLGSTPAMNPDVLFVITLLFSLASNFIINMILYLQSHFKTFTLLSLSKDQSIESSENVEINAFQNWCVIYNNLILIKYSSVFSLALNYLINNRLLLNNYWVELRILVFLLLVVSQFLVNMSIMGSIGRFGWFYGDFFLVSQLSRSKYINNCLSRSGIYRYLNQPERFTSLMTIFGLAILFNSFRFLILASIWVVSTFILINFIERQHMIKIYGETVLTHKSGVSKSINQLFIPKPVQGRINVVNGNVDKIIDDTSRVVDEFIRRRFSNENQNEKYIKVIRSNSASQLTIMKTDKSSDTLKLGGDAIIEEDEENEGSLKFLNIKEDMATKTKFFYLGDEISLYWQSPLATPKAWIGLYKILATQRSKLTTLISSKNHWIGLQNGSYNQDFSKEIVSCEDHEGEVTFTKKFLYFEPGVYELRLYNDESHNVSFISEPFEFRVKKLDIPLEINDKFIDEVSEIFEKFSKYKEFKDCLSDEKEISEFNKFLNLSIGFSLNLNSIYKCQSIKDLCLKIITVKKLIDEIR